MQNRIKELEEQLANINDKKTQILKLLNEPDFEENLKTLKLNEEQINEVLKALKKQRDENK